MRMRQRRAAFVSHDAMLRSPWFDLMGCSCSAGSGCVLVGDDDTVCTGRRRGTCAHEHMCCRCDSLFAVKRVGRVGLNRHCTIGPCQRSWCVDCQCMTQKVSSVAGTFYSVSGNLNPPLKRLATRAAFRPPERMLWGNLRFFFHRQSPAQPARPGGRAPVTGGTGAGPRGRRPAMARFVLCNKWLVTCAYIVSWLTFALRGF